MAMKKSSSKPQAVECADSDARTVRFSTEQHDQALDDFYTISYGARTIAILAEDLHEGGAPLETEDGIEIKVTIQALVKSIEDASERMSEMILGQLDGAEEPRNGGRE